MPLVFFTGWTWASAWPLIMTYTINSLRKFRTSKSRLNFFPVSSWEKEKLKSWKLKKKNTDKARQRERSRIILWQNILFPQCNLLFSQPVKLPFRNEPPGQHLLISTAGQCSQINEGEMKILKLDTYTYVVLDFFLNTFKGLFHQHH